MRLFRSEFLRARSRRLVKLLLLGGLLAIVVGLGIGAIYSTPASQADIDQAQASYDKQVQRCMSGRDLQPGGALPPGYDSLEELCRQGSGPYLSDAGVWLHDLPEVLQGISMFVILLGAWLGASLGGADWTSNTMTTLLTWEPRRLRVLLTRALVVAIFVVAITAFLQLVFVGLYDLVAHTRGTTAFSPSDLWADVGATLLRVAAVGGAFGLIAYAIAMIGRSTVAALGVLFGYLVLVEGVIVGFRPSIEGKLLVRAATVIVSQNPLINYSDTGAVNGAYPEPTILLGVAGAVVVTGAYVLALLVIAAVLFRRRDVS